MDTIKNYLLANDCKNTLCIVIKNAEIEEKYLKIYVNINLIRTKNINDIVKSQKIIFQSS